MPTDTRPDTTDTRPDTTDAELTALAERVARLEASFLELVEALLGELELAEEEGTEAGTRASYSATAGPGGC